MAETEAYVAQVLLSSSVICLFSWLVLGMDFSEENPRVNPYANMSPWWPIFFCSLYVVVVKRGPVYFANRPAWRCDGWMLVFNVFQAFLNLYNVYGILYAMWRLNFTLVGNVEEKLDRDLGFFFFLHYVNKFFEFSDSLFMVLRKKNDQLSFLHVLHHGMMPWPWFFVLKYHPWGDAYFGALLNSTIHVFMYTYYAFALLKIPCPWKVYLTQMQLTQFFCIFVHGNVGMYMGFRPRWLAMFQSAIVVVFFGLFSVFYSTKYTKRE